MKIRSFDIAPSVRLSLVSGELGVIDKELLTLVTPSLRRTLASITTVLQRPMEDNAIMINLIV